MPYGLYIHLPFCRTRCPYCAFVSTAGSTHADIDVYVDAIIAEWSARRDTFGGKGPRTIFIGGGTPSVVPADTLKRLFSAIRSDATVEWTIEANPESATGEWCSMMRESGPDRISIGAQSFDDTILGHLGRIHTAAQAARSIEAARTAGFNNISLDLMYGVPGHTLSRWIDTLDTALALEPDHMSAYSLGIEEDTEYCRRMASDGLDLPDEDTVAAQYRALNARCSAGNLQRYEISNFARDGKKCLHNLGYWSDMPYCGLGAGSHSYDGTFRHWNEPDVTTYVTRCGRRDFDPPYNEILDPHTRMLEALMFGLRTDSGLSLNSAVFDGMHRGPVLERLQTWADSGFLVQSDGFWRVTVDGALLVDELAAECAVYLDG